jgi:serine/threonine protein kinase
LGNIHSSNVIHKDINPSNIVLNRATGTVKIIDFGIATRFARTNPSFKNPNVLEGTLAYISPEQTERMNRMLDYRTDFYSLGATFYELLVGQLLFVATRFAVGRFGNAQINRVDDERSLITIFVFDWSVSGLGSELNSSIDLLHESRKQSKFIIEESSNQVAT